MRMGFLNPIYNSIPRLSPNANIRQSAAREKIAIPPASDIPIQEGCINRAALIAFALCTEIKANSFLQL
jgi:hypothetical protein